jgi:voltage-gated potassium channel
MISNKANFHYLLAGLLLLLLAGPISHELVAYTGTTLINVAFTTTLIVSVWSLLDSRKWFIIGVALAVISVIVTTLDFLFTDLDLQLFSMSLALIFCILSFTFTMRIIIRGTEMNLNRMVGAICAYLLLGIALGLLNMFIHRLMPGSYTGISDSPSSLAGLDMIYYSFVTITTLGYGDISPVRPLARAVAYITAVAGQFYIAILVGMMVGAYMKQSD